MLGLRTVPLIRLPCHPLGWWILGGDILFNKFCPINMKNKALAAAFVLWTAFNYLLYYSQVLSNRYTLKVLRLFGVL
jgi:hypothetical protein